MADQTPRRTPRLLPLFIILLGLALLAAGVFLWSQNSQPPASQSSQQPTTQTQPGQPAAAPVAEPSFPDIKRVSLADAKAAYDAKTAVIVDVRDSASYAGAHIPGALNIPINDLATRIKELDPNQWIITYCT